MLTKCTCGKCGKEYEAPIQSRHRLLCGDASKEADALRLLDGQKADCVFTSPPYAVGVDYGIYQDTIENLRTMLPKLSRIWKQVLVEGGFAVVNFGDVLSGKTIAQSDVVCEYPMALEYWPVFRADGWALWSRRIWCKPGAACGSSQHCMTTNRAASNFEHIWTWKLPGKPPVDFQISGQYASQSGWFDTSRDNPPHVKKTDHGASMPVAVALRMITIHCRPDAIVYEPFCGTGTTLIAADEIGRRCFGSELEPRYCDIIVARFEQFTGKKAQRITL